MKDDVANHFDIVGILNARPISVPVGDRMEKRIDRHLQLFPDNQSPWCQGLHGQASVGVPCQLE